MFMKMTKRLLSILLSLVLMLGLMAGMSLTALAETEQSETIATTSRTVNGTHFTISSYFADSTYGMIAYKGQGGITVTPKNNEYITKVVITCDWQPGYVTGTTVSSGTVAITDGGGTITVTDVNASTFNFKCGSSTPAFNPFVVYYLDSAPTVPVTNIILDKTSATLTVDGEADALTAIVSPDGAMDKTVKWSVGGTNASAVTLYSDADCKTAVQLNTATDTLTVYAKPISAGFATVTVTSNADGSKSATCAVTVNKGNPTAPTSLTATYGQTLANVTLPTGWTWADSTTSVGNVVTPAATFKANFAGNDNYNAASNVDVTVTVGKADPTTPTGLTATYGQTLADVTLPANWAWADSETGVGDAGTKTFKANYTAPNANYNSKSNVDVSVTVGKANAVAATVTANSRTYDGTEKPLVAVTGEATGGTMYYELGADAENAPSGMGADTSIPAATDAGTYYVWYKVEGDENHSDSEPQVVTVVIAEAQQPVSNTFYFRKVWEGSAEKSIDFTLYRADGTVYRQGFEKHILSEKEWSYSAVFQDAGTCYVIEKPVPGYITRYVNVGEFAGITDRCCDGGTIINKKIPKTGDETPLMLWAGMLLVGAAGITVALTVNKRRKARK